MRSAINFCRSSLEDERFARLRLAVLASIFSKFLRLGSQTIILGIGVRHLGTDAFGLWLTAVAALAWLSWGQIGLAPGLVNAIAVAEGEGRKGDQAVYFVTALVLIVVLAIGVLLVGGVLIQFGGTLLVYFLSSSNPVVAALTGDAKALLYIALLLAIVRFPLALVESAYTGIQQIHILRFFEMFGQVVNVAVVIALFYCQTSINIYLVGAGLSTESGLIAAGLYLVTRLRPALWPSLSKFDLRSSKSMFSLSLAYLLIQVAGYLVSQAGIVILAACHGSGATPAISLTMQLYQMVAGVWMMFVSGLWGPFAEARARHDWNWIQHTTTLLLLGVMALSIGFSVLLAIGGDEILRLWSGGRIQEERCYFLAMAVMCSVHTWAVIHANILSALGFAWRQINAALANGVLAVIFSFLLIPRYSATGLALALLLASALTTGWALPVQLRKSISKGMHVTP